MVLRWPGQGDSTYAHSTHVPIPVALHGVLALILHVALVHAGLLVHLVDALVEVAGILVA